MEMPASSASSSRRRPGARRGTLAGIPTSAGSVRSRQVRSAAASSPVLTPRSSAAGGRRGGYGMYQDDPSLPRPERSAQGGVMTTSELTDRLALADDLVLTRMGYGAMQLAGPHVTG